MQRTVVEDFYRRKFVSTFKADRDLIVGLTDKDAHTVLRLLDGGSTHHEAPSEFRVALEAAKRSPDVSRYFLVEKGQRYVDEQFHRGKPTRAIGKIKELMVKRMV